MPSSSSAAAAATNDHCEHCHSEYSLIKRKKICAVCCQSFCSNCAPREHNQNHSYRICLICQIISNPTTADAQLLQIKVKHLRCYLQAKNISNNTCTEKQELVDLIKQNRHQPFTRFLNQQSTTMASPPPPQPSSFSSSKSSPFTNIQQTVSSFANQVNNFASNVQDYVTNTVSDVINTTIGDQPTTNPPPRTATTSDTASPQHHHPRPAAAATATASSTSTSKSRAHRKSLSEINAEENIEDLNIRELKEILAANFVDFKGCVEKSELMEKVRRLYRDRQQAQSRAQELGDSPTIDTELCKICMDALVDCVFLDCGHMLTCVKCGKLLAECPICRSNIVRVVRVFKS